jgi:hypothetical protein
VIRKVIRWFRQPFYDELRLPVRAVFVPDQVLMARLERAARAQQPNAIEQAWQRSRERKAASVCEVIEFHGRQK